MSNPQNSTKAAIIVGVCAIVAAGIGTVPVLTKSTRPSVSVLSGNVSQGVIVGGDIRESTITINSSAEESWTAEDRKIIEEVITSSESRNNSLTDSLFDHDAGLNAELAQNPYNVRALIIRGQSYYLQAKNFGKLRFRESLRDFELAAKTDKTLADPRFGIGTVLYYLAIYDIANRGLFKIRKKGVILSGKSGTSMSPPDWRIFTDSRSNILLKAALNEFQAGTRLRQLHFEESGGAGGTAVVFFDPDDVEQRVHTIRSLLDYEHMVAQPKELAMVFCSLRQAIDPANPMPLFEFGSAKRKTVQPSPR